MTALPTDSPRIERIPRGGGRRAVTWVAVAGAAGVLLLLLTFLAVRSRLPVQVPSHYGPARQVTATMPPGMFLLTAVGIQAVVAIVLSAVAYLALRSGVLEHQHGPGFGPAITAVLAVVAFAPALPTSLLLAADAGYVPAGAGLSLVVGVAFLIVPVAVIIAVFGTRSRSTGGLSDGARFECSSCGASFPTSTWRWVVGPHVGGSVYLTCPVCGERGWDRRVGTRYFPGSPGSDGTRAPSRRPGN